MDPLQQEIQAALERTIGNLTINAVSLNAQLQAAQREIETLKAQVAAKSTA